jgi:ABC-type lipoprotein export system ATPase subunit
VPAAEDLESTQRVEAQPSGEVESAVEAHPPEGLESAAETVVVASRKPAANAVTDFPVESAKLATPRKRRVPAVKRELEPEELMPEFRGLLGEPVGLRLDSVSRSFRQGTEGVSAVEDVSFEILPGEFVAVLGPSGSGKSTLLGLLGGLDRPTSGRIFAAGTALDQISEHDLADYRLQRVGTVFESFNLLPALNVADNIGLPLMLAGVPREERVARVGRLLEVVGLQAKATEWPARLSGGEKQRVAVARALANRPGLILADEPTGNLDSVAGRRVLNLLSELNERGVTVVLVTHEAAQARRAGRVFKMSDGKLTAGRSKRRAIRAPDSLDPPLRLTSRDSLALGLSNAIRNPVRTGLTAAGVGLGISLMTAILALATGARGAGAPAYMGRALLGLALIASIVASLGILNTMYAAVLERTAEIGVLKALGARNADLRLLFMAESAVIGTLAGVVGVIFGSVLALFGNLVTGTGVFQVDIWIGLAFLLLAISLSTVGGLLPALRATRLDPAGALRQP